MLARFFAVLLLLGSFPAAAEEAGQAPAIGAPVPWGIGLQQAFSPMKHRMHDFHAMMLVIITAIVVLVMGLLIYVIVRFNAKTNPTPKTFAHNTLLEVVWTALPVLILLAVAVPSMQLLYYLDKAPQPELSVKVTGHQWYWSYAYPDQKIDSFDSRPIWDGTPQTANAITQLLDDAKPNWLIPTAKPLRLLEVDNRLVLPIDTQVRIYTTGADVIHSWAIPALGIKKDAVPGHLNETWLKIDREGVYYGQCDQLCGMGHGFMPVVIEAVSKDKFAAWVAKKQPPAPAPAASPAVTPPAAAAPSTAPKTK